MGSRKSFDIEEEFDLSLLGVTESASVELHRIAKGRALKAASEPHAVANWSDGRTTGAVIRRPRNGRYESADWTPDVPSARRTAVPSGREGPLDDAAPVQEPKVENLDYAEPAAAEVLARPTSPTASTKAPSNGADSTVKVADIEARLSPPSAPAEKSSKIRIQFRKGRLPSGRVRPGVRILPPTPATMDNDIRKPSSTPSPPALPLSTFQRDIISHFGLDTIDKLEALSKQRNNTGAHLPLPFRDFFPTLASNKATIEHANELRALLDLPALSVRSDRVALRRTIAVMRERLYIEIAAALILPDAPLPSTKDETADGDTKWEKPDLSLTPSSLATMAKTLPKAFPHEASAIKAFLKHPRAAYGEEGRTVIWDRGVGRMLVGKAGEGYRDQLDGESRLHIFVDHSNILHGLLNHLLSSKSTALPPRHLRTLSLPCLSLLLRRGRPTPLGTLHLVASSPLHQDLDPLVRLGWDVSVLKRVEVFEEENMDHHLAHTKMNGYAMERQDTGVRRHREQAVDEILCLKVLQTLNTKGVVAPPGSKIVLATGDARGGQFNADGFLGAVMEALKRGWQVELWSWSEGLSRAWADIARREKWGKEFHIYLLDTWAEQLVEVLPDDEDD